MSSRAPQQSDPRPQPSDASAAGVSIPRRPAYGEDMWTVLVILLVAWAVLSVVGFVFEGLLWLAIIGIILFIGTVVFGLVRSRTRKG